MFRKILIVNRGEIAARVIRACNELSIRAAVVYSTADVSAFHTRIADESYHLPGMTSAETYLNIPAILKVAKEIGAEAIHPGYGFLSENEAFIRAVEESGITFIGPSSKSVSMMGSKTAARQLMKSNGVPIVPGTTEPITDTEAGIRSAREIGYPVLLKASAGGGGKGMKEVHSEDRFEEAFSSAQREAARSFGNDAVYIEKLILNPKHIEVQIIGDKHGNYAHLFERECSMQRRHQKIIEEAPSSFVDEDTRERITTAAVQAARACGYYNAGTIEFLMDKNRDFYFLEMNTRLQVEHPVTELITGVDLVREQISIAAGNRLSFSQSELAINGHAVECRVYAEDPGNNFLPSTGRINSHRLPTGPGVRVDEGIDTGTEITLHYDPLLTKISVHAGTRDGAIRKMVHVLSRYHISGVHTNIPFLRWLLRQNDFTRGNYSINFIDENFLSGDPLKILAAEKEPLLDAAAAFAVLFKQSKKLHSGSNTVDGKSGSNKWKDQMYE